MVGVETTRGVIATPAVVNAAGSWAGQIGAMVGVEVPVEPVRRQIAVTTPLTGVPADFPFVIDFSRSLYFHREGKGILSGQSNTGEKPGFNQSDRPRLDGAAPGERGCPFPSVGGSRPVA